MLITVTFGNERYTADLRHPRHIAIPVRFDGPQLSVFGAPPARSQPFTAGDFVGKVSQGGSCNCDVYTFVPHTNGTHTECVGHITQAALSVHDLLKDSLIPATLITVTPQPVRTCRESYEPRPQDDDLLITFSSLNNALQAQDRAFLQGLIIRTLPNPAEKITRQYTLSNSPFFSSEAIRYLHDLGVHHLLADIPSVDRLADEGKLTNHRTFWNVPRGAQTTDTNTAVQKTITELIYVPDSIVDGHYLLNLQVAPFMTDAAPSRPILYELVKQ